MTNITPIMGTRGGGGRAEPPKPARVQRVHATLANLMQSYLASVRCGHQHPAGRYPGGDYALGTVATGAPVQNGAIESHPRRPA